jgi:arylsulfatase A-like enzyme
MQLTRREWLAGAAAGSLPQTSGRAGSRPNVIFFMTDDHGAWAMGPEGCRDMHTPNLAQLASEGARFSNAFACTPVCSPSRMTWLTGKLPSLHGVQDALTGDSGFDQHFLKGQLTYSQVLADHGYTLGMCGKWHMGYDAHPQAGFTYWRTVPGGGRTYRDPEFVVNGKKVVYQGFKTDLVGDFALEFIEQNRARPFFLHVPFFAPHTPFDYQPEAYRGLYKNSSFPCFPERGRHPQRRATFESWHGNREMKLSYAALISGMDHNVGRILRRVEELGLRGNTLVVFSADQGWNAGHHGLWGKGNATIPFNMYEESIRTPLIWSHPGRIRGGRVLTPLVSSYDFFPTILEYLGVPVESHPQRVGQSYAPFLRGEQLAWRQELYFEYCYVRSIRTPSMKYVERTEEWPSELFDLEADPSEEVNLIGDRRYRDRLTHLRLRLRSFFEKAGAPPLADWRSTTRQKIPIDSGYYDGWSARPQQQN